MAVGGATAFGSVKPSCGGWKPIHDHHEYEVVVGSTSSTTSWKPLKWKKYCMTASALLYTATGRPTVSKPCGASIQHMSNTAYTRLMAHTVPRHTKHTTSSVSLCECSIKARLQKEPSSRIGGHRCSGSKTMARCSSSDHEVPADDGDKTGARLGVIGGSTGIVLVVLVVVVEVVEVAVLSGGMTMTPVLVTTTDTPGAAVLGQLPYETALDRPTLGVLPPASNLVRSASIRSISSSDGWPSIASSSVFQCKKMRSWKAVATKTNVLPSSGMNRKLLPNCRKPMASSEIHLLFGHTSINNDAKASNWYAYRITKMAAQPMTTNNHTRRRSLMADSNMWCNSKHTTRIARYANVNKLVGVSSYTLARNRIRYTTSRNILCDCERMSAREHAHGTTRIGQATAYRLTTADKEAIDNCRVGCTCN